MGAVLAVLVCGGGCLVVCWLMMTRMHAKADPGDRDQDAS